jgi:hypothetical protein
MPVLRLRSFLPAGDANRAINLRRRLEPRRFRADVSGGAIWFQLYGGSPVSVSVPFRRGVPARHFVDLDHRIVGAGDMEAGPVVADVQAAQSGAGLMDTSKNPVFRTDRGLTVAKSWWKMAI